jgi:hypothetical protein
VSRTIGLLSRRDAQASELGLAFRKIFRAHVAASSDAVARF